MPLPVPDERTKGVLVFSTVDGHVIAGPTAIDLQDERDRSVRPQALAAIRAKLDAPPEVTVESGERWR